MKILRRQDLLDLVDGVAIFSAGGGGDPVGGHRIVEKLISEGHIVRLVSPSEVPDNARVVNFACVGATSTLDYYSAAAVKTLQVLEQYAGFSTHAIIPVELGGFNTLAAVDVAARRGIPVVDADGAGRAVPEVHLKVYTIDDIPLAPMVISDVHGKNVVIVRETADLRAAERIARALATEWNHSAYTARRILTGVQVKTSPVQHSLSRSMYIGKLLRENVEPMKAVLKETKGFKLFKGVVDSVEQKTDAAFTFVNVRLRGSDEFADSIFEFKAKNEVLVAYKDQKLSAIAPDIVTPVGPENCKCITAERIHKGDILTVLGLPSPQKWRTTKGLELWKDVLQRANITEKYIPIENLHKTLCPE